MNHVAMSVYSCTGKAEAEVSNPRTLNSTERKSKTYTAQKLKSSGIATQRNGVFKHSAQGSVNMVLQPEAEA